MSTGLARGVGTRRSLGRSTDISIDSICLMNFFDAYYLSTFEKQTVVWAYWSGFVYLFMVVLLTPSPFDALQANPGLAFAFSFFSCFTCVFATFDVLPVFFHGFGTPVFLPHIFHILASCSSILLVLFLVFIFVHFYLVKCTFLQNIVNYDAWHTFGSLPLAGAALESCFDVLTVFFYGFWNAYIFTSCFSCFGILLLHTFGLVFGLYFCTLLPCGGGGPINSQKTHLLLKHHIPKEHSFRKNLGPPQRAQPRIFKNLGHPQTAQPSFSEILCLFLCSFLCFF